MPPIDDHANSRLGLFPPDLPANAAPTGTKGRILASALAAFAERGFHGTSIRTIADGAAINSATLYSHFPSKEHILGELVAIGSRELLARLRASLAGAESSADRLDVLIGATVVAHATFPLLAVVTNREFSALSLDRAEPAIAPTREAAGLLRETLESGMADGSFSVSSPEVTAHVLEGMAQQIPHWITPLDDPATLADQYIALSRRIVGSTRQITDDA